MDLPDTLNATLTRRLDHLGMAKAVAQTASVIGWRIPALLLRSIAPGDEFEVEISIEAMLRSGLVVTGFACHEECYVFKHILVRDAAYATIALRERERVHRQVAEAIERHYPRVVESTPELLAWHYRRAQMKPEAAAYSLRASDRALTIAGYTEAVAHLEAALGDFPHHCEFRQEIEARLFALNARPGTAGADEHLGSGAVCSKGTDFTRERRRNLALP